MADPQAGDTMTAADRVLHSTQTRCVHPDDTVTSVALLMRDLDVRALPLRGLDDRFVGMITERDIVTECIATGLDPSTTTAGQLAGDSARRNANAPHIDEALAMSHLQWTERIHIGEGAMPSRRQRHDGSASSGSSSSSARRS